MIQDKILMDDDRMPGISFNGIQRAGEVEKDHTDWHRVGPRWG